MLLAANDLLQESIGSSPLAAGSVASGPTWPERLSRLCWPQKKKAPSANVFLLSPTKILRSTSVQRIPSPHQNCSTQEQSSRPAVDWRVRRDPPSARLWPRGPATTHWFLPGSTSSLHFSFREAVTGCSLCFEFVFGVTTSVALLPFAALQTSEAPGPSKRRRALPCLRLRIPAASPPRHLTILGPQRRGTRAPEGQQARSSSKGGAVTSLRRADGGRVAAAAPG